MHSLYRHFDKRGRLLYVGVSKNAIARIRGHKNASWYSKISNVTIEHFEHRVDALAAEQEAIHAESPIHNKQRYVAKKTEASKQRAMREDREKNPQQFRPASCAFARMHVVWREMHKVQPEPRIKSVQSFYNWKSTNKGKRPPFEGLIADTPLEQVETDDE